MRPLWKKSDSDRCALRGTKPLFIVYIPQRELRRDRNRAQYEMLGV